MCVKWNNNCIHSVRMIARDHTFLQWIAAPFEFSVPWRAFRVLHARAIRTSTPRPRPSIGYLYLIFDIRHSESWPRVAKIRCDRWRTRTTVMSRSMRSKRRILVHDTGPRLCWMDWRSGSSHLCPITHWRLSEYQAALPTLA